MELKSLATIVLLLSACTSLSEHEHVPGKADDPSKRSCEKDGSDGDGTCDLDCIQPDIDCFRIFDGSQELEAF